MLSFISKIKFSLKKPKVIIIASQGRQAAKEAILKVLSGYFKIGENILIFDSELEDMEELKFFIKKSSLPVLVITHLGEIPSDKYSFAGKKNERILQLAKIMPDRGCLVLNFDDETVREIKAETGLNELTFGFQERADFKATDIKLNGGTNFKINYKGTIVPAWLDGLFGKEQIYAALAATCVGKILELNLVEISQALKNYKA